MMHQESCSPDILKTKETSLFMLNTLLPITLDGRSVTCDRIVESVAGNHSHREKGETTANSEAGWEYFRLLSEALLLKVRK